jgi:hypothetical protein
VLLVEVFSKGLQIGPFSMTHYGRKVHIVYKLELDLFSYGLAKYQMVWPIKQWWID